MRRETERAADVGIPVLAVLFDSTVTPGWLRYHISEENVFFFRRDDLPGAALHIMLKLQETSFCPYGAWQPEYFPSKMDTKEFFQQVEQGSQRCVAFSGELRPVYALWFRIGEETPIWLQTLMLASVGNICHRSGALPIPTALPGVLHLFDSLALGNASEVAIGCGLAIERFLIDASRKPIENGMSVSAGVGLTVHRAISASGSALIREIENSVEKARELAEASDNKLLVSEEFHRMCGYFCRFIKHSSNGYAIETLAAPQSEECTGHSTVLIGREIELSRLRAAVKALKNAAEEPGLGCTPHKIIGIRGGVGLGKSRLVCEFVKELKSESGITVVPALQCDSLWKHDGIWGSLLGQLQTALMGKAELQDDVLDYPVGMPEKLRLFLHRYGTGCSPAPAVEELESWRENLFKLLELVASINPLVVVLEDVDQADSSSLETLRTLSSSQSFNAKILFVLTYCDSNGDLMNRFSLPTGESICYEEIELNPLNADDAETLLTSLCWSSEENCCEVDQAAMKLLLRLAGGNPLFLKQLLNHSLDQNLLKPQYGRRCQINEYEFLAPVMEAAALTLFSRLDRRQRDLIRIASVMDRDFSVNDMVTFCDDQISRDDLASQLSKLVREGLLVIDSSSFTTEHRFAQEYFRLVAYNTIPQDDLALLKEGR